MGLFAAIGIQVAFATEDRQPRLWWSDDVTPHAIIDKEFTIDLIVQKALKEFSLWKESPAIKPQRTDGSKMPKSEELKLLPEDIKVYLDQAERCTRGRGLATALLAQGSLDNNGIAKPSDFYFMAGQQKFLDIAHKILTAANHDEIKAGLEGPWRYESDILSLGWDVADDRVYALMANDPSAEKKKTNPGPEALALLGVSLYPVFAKQGRTKTQGCSGTWKKGHFSWPIWRKPAYPSVVKSLLAHAYDCDRAVDSNRHRWYKSWGISTILRSPIRRTNQGGYGTFGPPEIMWQQA